MREERKPSDEVQGSCHQLPQPMHAAMPPPATSCHTIHHGTVLLSEYIQKKVMWRHAMKEWKSVIGNRRDRRNVLQSGVIVRHENTHTIHTNIVCISAHMPAQQMAVR